ncbi:MAG: hypothetical protein CVT63_04490 [Candidatus Anoxymicrobium japonicum]|uniref:AAA domain-containing protein n=1 Tax=Candidatus Anoxymicrobium japonicum TaxID=2013648 RepID=A0A2N3G5V0_9ACTN|nr:MAG: hypothetical protein CVT63_04490 [Candidatus Anoxymicrobium japonicum]
MPADRTRNRRIRADSISSVHRLNSAVARMPGAVVFHGGKGGVGTTMLATEMTMALASVGRRVAALDADLDRGSMHYRLDVSVGRATFSIADVLPVLEDITDDALRGALSTCPCGASLLPPPVGRAGLAPPDAAHAGKLLSALASNFDYVIIDTRAALDPFTTGLLMASDLIALVVTPELACLGGAKRAVTALDALPGERPRIELLINRSLGARDLVTRGDIESYLGMKASAVLPEDTAMCRRLEAECKSLLSDRSALSCEVFRLSRALFG